MKAFEARKEYFEKYILFEHYVKALAQVLEIKTKGKSLNVIIDQIVSHSKFKFLELTASSIRAQKHHRNWLAHMNSNANASDGMISVFELIDDLNQKLINAKKWCINDKKKIKAASQGAAVPRIHNSIV